MTLDVVGFGALNLDKLYVVNTLAERGEERIIRGCIEVAGGSAANTIVGLPAKKTESIRVPDCRVCSNI